MAPTWPQQWGLCWHGVWTEEKPEENIFNWLIDWTLVSGDWSLQYKTRCFKAGVLAFPPQRETVEPLLRSSRHRKQEQKVSGAVCDFYRPPLTNYGCTSSRFPTSGRKRERVHMVHEDWIGLIVQQMVQAFGAIYSSQKKKNLLITESTESHPRS